MFCQRNFGMDINENNSWCRNKKPLVETRGHNTNIKYEKAELLIVA